MFRFPFALVAAVSVFAVSGVASAADMPVKAPVAPAIAPYSWTGFYVGVNAGGAIGRNPTTMANETTGASIGSFKMSPAGFIGGGQLGYNWQFAPNWVVGVEGDFQAASAKDNACIQIGCTDPGIQFFFTAEQKLKWFATARARLGYTDGDWLWYVTGGGAWAKLHNEFAVFTPTDLAGNADFNRSGWVVGAGVETHIWGPWSAKLEYLYLNLGSFTDVVVDTANTNDTFTMKSDVRDHIVRVGLNYKLFGGPTTGGAWASAYASAAAPWKWTGLYIGANAGGSVGRNPTVEQNASNGFFLGSFTMSPAGFVGGGQLGYNWQFAPNWLVGVEGDIQGATQKDSSCLGAGCSLPGSFYFTAEQKLKWFATARARFGYTDGDWLWYVTGGGAWAQVHNDFRTFTPTDALFSADFNLSGWAIGGGVETHLWGNWSAKLEYLYMDLGQDIDGGVDPNTLQIYTMTTNVRGHIVRAGLNYKFF